MLIVDGQGWGSWDEMNDHQVGWGHPRKPNGQKYRMNKDGWYDETNDHQVGWGTRPPVASWRL